MKKLSTGMMVLAVSTGLITGCSTNNTRDQNTGLGAAGGAVVGGVASGVLGGNPVAIGLSAVAGALVGGYIGHSMDSSDTTNMNTAMMNDTNIPKYWKNPNTGIVYRITPTSNMMTVNGNKYCRTFTASAVVKGKRHVNKGLACRQSDGGWVMMKK